MSKAALSGLHFMQEASNDRARADSVEPEHAPLHPDDLVGYNACIKFVQGGNMKSKATRLSVLLAALVGFTATVLPVAPAEAQWVFVARKALGRIQHMAEAQQQGGRPGYDFATVLLDSPADKVFATALELARKNPSVRVVMQDPGQRRFQIAEGDRTATLNVVPFSDDVSQLLIAGHAASPAEGSTASRVVQAVLRVCKEMGKHCEIGG
jgi:hypothetical protein